MRCTRAKYLIKIAGRSYLSGCFSKNKVFSACAKQFVNKRAGNSGPIINIAMLLINISYFNNNILNYFGFCFNLYFLDKVLRIMQVSCTIKFNKVLECLYLNLKLKILSQLVNAQYNSDESENKEESNEIA